MLKLNASYSKKVPAEAEYSSQSFHAQIEVELPDGLSQQQLQDKVHGVFEFVRSSVESELRSVTSQRQLAQPQPRQMQPFPANALPADNVYERIPDPRRSHDLRSQDSRPQQQFRSYGRPGSAASTKQVNYLLALAKRAGWSVQQLTDRCGVASVNEIPSRQCSELIAQLTGKAA